MRKLARDCFVAAAAVRKQGNEIGHGAACREEAGFLAHTFGRHRFQALYGGVVAKGIITHLGGGHGLAHGGRGLRDGIGAQVDDALGGRH